MQPSLSGHMKCLYRVTKFIKLYLPLQGILPDGKMDKHAFLTFFRQKKKKSPHKVQWFTILNQLFFKCKIICNLL